MDSDITTALQALDRKIAKLTDLRAGLAAEFGATGKPVRSAGPATEGTRKKVLVDFLRTNGPLKRAEIIKRTGFPKGTIAYCLNDKKVFRRREDKRYEPV